jgi:hypothetical protein
MNSVKKLLEQHQSHHGEKNRSAIISEEHITDKTIPVKKWVRNL